MAVVVAAGLGVRMGAGVPKALLPLAGRPLVAWAVGALQDCDAVDGIVVVAPPGHEDEMRAAAGPAGKLVATVPGGATRSRSVARGLAALPPGDGVVLVHDAARPLAGAAGVAAVLAGIGDADGAIAAAPLADTLKREEEGVIAGTVDRSRLWLAQTPQAFRRPVLEAAFAAADDAALDAATDCAWLVERAGGRVRLVDLGAPNLKVTTPADVAVAEALLRAVASP
ncbi:MAG: 2-C-methyl-D-erythritol 4-phosphate cytidylyltransferase [Actinomycetota bacterium]